MIISVCIPCYRSENNLAGVVEEIKDEFKKHEGYDYEIVLVNDGSPDDTFRVIEELCLKDKKIIGVNLSRNHGQTAAKLAAVNYATGDVAVFMDDDGQHPAYGIFKLVEKINEGNDVVYARFPKRKHSLFKRFTSMMKKKLAEMTGTKLKGVDTSSFMAWSRVPMKAIKKYQSPFPSAGAYLRCVTTKFANVDMEHRQRASGKSGYTFNKLFKLWLDGFTNFSMAPLRFATYTGSVVAFFGFILAIVIIIKKLMNPDMAAGYASTIAIILFIGGMIMLMLGIIGEYVGRMYMIASDKPQYTVAREINTLGDDEE